MQHEGLKSSLRRSVLIYEGLLKTETSEPKPDNLMAMNNHYFF